MTHPFLRIRITAAAFLLITGSAAPSAVAAQHAHGHQAATMPATADVVPLRNDLGRLTRRIVTRDARAQRYFDQGLRWYYAFNHAESVRSFREAQRLDPSCAMCTWGEALALGPNMNAPMSPEAEVQAIAATRRGIALSARAESATEGALLSALALRYYEGPVTTRAGRDSAYASAMRSIAEARPRDPDVLALAAEARMDLSPWTYWTKDGSARTGTPELLAWLQRAMAVTPDHPGACHFYIHAVEAAHPERAVACAERLAALMPGAGHIVHMPAHIYIRVGRWADAITANKHAVHADEQYFDGPHTPDALFYAAAYQSHNHHFLTLAAGMAGASALAIESGAAVTRIVSPDIARAVPVLQPMLAVPVQALVTFGKWDAVLAMPLPAADLRITTAHFWYARGVAFAATGRTLEARATVDSITAVLTMLPAGDARATLEIAALAVRGEIELRGGHAADAVTLFQQAVRIEDQFSYMEPPTWYYPMRHSLGKALLAAGNAREAEQVYRADLQRFPENGWSLKGLQLALTAQGRARDADAVARRFEVAWRKADVTITSSRF
ncbi:MAG: hypothetical protein V4813_00685 [Gemmatimonadota bacterium]